MSAQQKLKICEVNPHIVCSLCAGYFIDATTITECLHTFCRSCIVKHFQTNKCCPTCNVKVHETQPLLNCRTDRTMQEVVYKLVPNLQKSERQRRERFYRSKGLPSTGESASSRGASTEVTTHVSYDDERVGIVIERHPNFYKEVKEDQLCGFITPFERKYIRCPAMTTILHVQKFLTQKLSPPNVFEVELFCDDLKLNRDFTLKYVWIAKWRKREPPLVIHYRFRLNL